MPVRHLHLAKPSEKATGIEIDFLTVLVERTVKFDEDSLNAQKNLHERSFV